MSDFEDGELPSSDTEEAPDPVDSVYQPLERPHQAQERHGADGAAQGGGADMLMHPRVRPRTHTNSSLAVNVGEEDSDAIGNLRDDDGMNDGDDDELLLDADKMDKMKKAAAGGGGADSDSSSNFSWSSSDGSDCSGDELLTPEQRRARRKAKKRAKGPTIKKRTRRQNDDAGVMPSSSGGEFARLASAFQESRARAGLPSSKSKKNNV